MHNLLSRAQLDEWRHFEDTLDDLSIENQNLMTIMSVLSNAIR